MKSVVIFSGGQDSTMCLAIALKKGEVLQAVSYNYGQKHEKELLAAAEICKKYGVDHNIVDLRPALKNMRSSALINHGDTSEKHPILEDLPASFVPVRNALFITVAYGIAMELGADALYTGVCQTDYSGYPDCRDLFIKQLNKALDIGYASTIQIMTPLMYMDKADTFKLAEDLGWSDTNIDMTLTCYNGSQVKHAWGRGCGDCGACRLREHGYNVYLERYHNTIGVK